VPSLLLPLLVLGAVAFTGVLAISVAALRAKDCRRSRLAGLIVIYTVLGVVGPVERLAAAPRSLGFLWAYKF
jgi:hypothetical protein